MFCCWRTAMRCPDDGRIGWSLRRISPSTTLPEADAVASARRKSRSKPRTFSPSMPSPNGISDCSIDIGITTSKPATLAPPSRIAARTRPISPVQVSIGEPLNGAARSLSSSIAMTTAGEAGRILPSAEHLPPQRRKDIDGEAVDRLQWGRDRDGRADQRDRRECNHVARGAPDLQDGPPDKAYSMRSKRPTIGVAPGLACGSTRNTICDDLNVAA